METGEGNVGIRENYTRAFAACDAEYIAVMEGDDFWTTPYRLQKHADFLDEHYECAMTSNSMIGANYEESRFWQHPWIGEMLNKSNYSNGEYVLADVRDAIKCHIVGNFSTCVIRNSVFRRIAPDYLRFPFFSDFVTSIMVCRLGMMGFLLPVMNVYRVHQKGVYSKKPLGERHKSHIAHFQALDEATGGIYYDEFLHLIQYERTQLERLDALERPKEQENPDMPKSSSIKRALRFIWRITPPVLLFIVKALLPKIVSEKLRYDDL